MDDDLNMDIGYAQYLDRKKQAINCYSWLYDIEKIKKDTREAIEKAFKYANTPKIETRLYNCGGLPVSVTLPMGEHYGLDHSVYWMSEYGNI